jgi:hypothetical protein
VVFVYAAPKVLIAERVPPRHDPGLAVIYTARRLLVAGTELRLITNSDVYGIVVDDDDLLPHAAERVLEPGFDTSRVKDHDDDTYATPATGLAAYTWRDHVEWDLGSVAPRIVYARLYSRLTCMSVSVGVSADRVRWGVAVECAGAVCTGAFHGSFRYVRLRSKNDCSFNAGREDFRYYSVEVYPPNIRKVFTATADVYKTLRVFSRYSSQLLEFMRVA